MDLGKEKKRSSNSFKLDTSTSKRDKLYQSLEADRVSHFKSALFDVFITLEGCDSKNKISKQRLAINYTALFIRKLQLLSLILINFEATSNISLESALSSLLKVLRFDAICAELNLGLGFLVLLVISIWCLGLNFFIIYVQAYRKKNHAIKSIVCIITVLGWFYEYLLWIPYLYSVGIYSKYTFFVNNSRVSEYSNIDSNGFNSLWSIPLIFGLPILVSNIFFRTIYYCNPCYTSKLKRNRLHSLVSMKDLLCQLLMIFSSFYNSTFHFNMISGFISIYMIFQYTIYLPFVSIFDNTFEAGTWILVLLGIISYQISREINTASIHGLIIVFLFPCIIMLLYYLMHWYFNRTLNSKKQNPYSVELKIRKLILGIKPKDFTSSLNIEIKKIFKDSTKIYLSFKMLFVWECLFYLHYERNKHLALMKISKINFSCQKHLNIWYQSNKNKLIHYSYPNIEPQYLFYSYYKKLVNEEHSEDLVLLRYIRDINSFRKSDLEVSCELWDVYRKLADISAHSVKSIQNTCLKLGKAKKRFEEKAEKMYRRYHSDPEVLSIYGSYIADFLGEEEGKLLLHKSRSLKDSKDLGVEKFTGFQYHHLGASIMIVSGMFGSIGDILYLNKEICELLQIELVDDYIGTSFCQFIPAPFDVMHNDILRRNLISGDRIELYRPSLFLITTSGNCVEVTMHFRLVFFKQIPYFVADFNEKGHNTNLILHSPDGYIYAASKNINDLIGERKGTVFEVIHNLADYYKNNSLFKPFEYHEDFNCVMMRVKLVIDGSPLEALYIAQNYEYFKEGGGSVNHYEESQKSGSVQEFGFKTDVSMVASKSLMKSNITNYYMHQSTLLSRIEKKKKSEKSNLESSQITKLCSLLNFNIRFSLLVLFSITIATLATEKIITNELKMSSFLNSFDIMRFYGISIIQDSRSLNLLEKGYLLTYPEEFYRSSLQSNLENFEKNLMSAGDDIYKRSYMHNVFSIAKVSSTEKYGNNTFRTIKINLFQNLQKIIKEGSIILNTELADFPKIDSSFAYLYMNYPWETFNHLNDSVYISLEDIESHTEWAFEFLKSLKLTFFIPSLLIIMLSIPSIIKLEKINKKNWKCLCNLDIERQIEIRDKLIDRLYVFHGVQVDEVEHKYSRNAIFYSHWKSFMLKILILEILSLGYYFAAVYGFHGTLKEILISQSEFIFYSGTRGMLSSSAFFWARETFLDTKNDSLSVFIGDFYPFPSPKKQLQSMIDDCLYAQNYIDYRKPHKYYDDNMINLLIGNPCESNDKFVQDCTKSYISMGIKPAIKIYLNELKRVPSYNKADWQDINDLEKYSKIIDNSTIYMQKSYINSTDSKIDSEMDDLIISTLLYFFFLLIISFLLILSAVSKIKRDLLGKIDILKYF
ncbi:unnamed protein product [Blepharisma stoltei]|uniref:PAS domain-containing protein n=1 Tax=Blepharisma stoltei TaxID=1481888 RepID=A0AAU9JJ57_9CILI|nr:unnamed protein product [Blepharisma stoltei]